MMATTLATTQGAHHPLMMATTRADYSRQGSDPQITDTIHDGDDTGYSRCILQKELERQTHHERKTTSCQHSPNHNGKARSTKARNPGYIRQLPDTKNRPGQIA